MWDWVVVRGDSHTYLLNSQLKSFNLKLFNCSKYILKLSKYIFDWKYSPHIIEGPVSCRLTWSVRLLVCHCPSKKSVKKERTRAYHTIPYIVSTSTFSTSADTISPICHKLSNLKQGLNTWNRLGYVLILTSTYVLKKIQGQTRIWSVVKQGKPIKGPTKLTFLHISRLGSCSMPLAPVTKRL